MLITYNVDWEETISGWAVNEFEIIEIADEAEQSDRGSTRPIRRRLRDILMECLDDAITVFIEAGGRTMITQDRVEVFLFRWIGGRWTIMRALSSKLITIDQFCEAVLAQFNAFRETNEADERPFGISLGWGIVGQRPTYILDDFDVAEYSFEDAKTKIEACLSKWSDDNGLQTRKTIEDCFIYLNGAPSALTQESMNVVALDNWQTTNYWLEVFFWVNPRELNGGTRSG